jgi:hypothetical protein
VVSGDVVFRVMYVLALIGAVPASIIGFVVGAGTLASMITSIGETATLTILAVDVAIFVFIIVFLIVRYPVPGGSTIALQIGILSSTVILTIFLTYIYEFALPVYTSSLYAIFTLAFVDVFLLFMAMLVAIFIYIERL